MQLTAVLTLSTSLLAGHVWALHADPENPMGIHNPNLYNNEHAPASHGPASHAPAAKPEIPAYMAPLVSSMASEMAMSMMHKPTSTLLQASKSHAPVAWSNAPMAPHPNLPTYSDVPMYSQGSMYSHLAMSTSAVSTPYAMSSQAPYSNMYNLPMSSMLTKASSTPSSSTAMATSSASHALTYAKQHFNQPQHSNFHPAQAQAPGGGGIAPIAPLTPGSNVAPVQLNSHHGSDEGNAFCLGQCYPSEEEAQCEKPMTSPVYRPALGCYTCCFTAGDF
ncbi:hypothetical protein N7448_009646 [Penicillium atrosanguineum]|uniref:Uncharacterized protein n=1 Tax=Penicillium atrosanguineum TaxID=1132637 RepID=A0A9W9U643_9EURO|nr:uncharacterized protein N7443_006892 [Penicillium atrosanguineum]KAJ5123549.1 hypothetical protein N7448_009646 [Penicillium atrosanguineum]KAJ5142178.1 hypothetical protein N7526_003173 [Penicillium atrosanguineum]KAJ5298772.1 hypothetical protein N7443_006892 [Penicillium atrosanguineum]KAJ5320963.1 hypothetical protein N7476_003965 [Penicillium atrosanguineum]